MELYIIIILMLTNIGFHVIYDFCSTLKIMKGEDKKYGTEDDGYEETKLPRLLMNKLGLIPALIIIKGISLIIIIGVFLLYYFGYINTWAPILAYIAMIAYAVILFRKHNFKYD